MVALAGVDIQFTFTPVFHDAVGVSSTKTALTLTGESGEIDVWNGNAVVNGGSSSVGAKFAVYTVAVNNDTTPGEDPEGYPTLAGNDIKVTISGEGNVRLTKTESAKFTAIRGTYNAHIKFDANGIGTLYAGDSGTTAMDGLYVSLAPNNTTGLEYVSSNFTDIESIESEVSLVSHDGHYYKLATAVDENMTPEDLETADKTEIYLHTADKIAIAQRS